ncbi:type II toxin-antitoxin system HicA family toxin [Acinetobacter bereziniae]|uniref:type II toxin-antitoxin system HicA family toxin n=1 Tax=Acinetobacter bereziniae TaxID=106648 RepID=UPI003AF9EA8B
MSYVQLIEVNVKRRDLIKFLIELGARFDEGSKHTKVYLNEKQTTIPRHTEINDHLVKAIKKQLEIES